MHDSVAKRKPHNGVIEADKIIGVKMALEKFELSMQFLLDRGSTWYRVNSPVRRQLFNFIHTVVYVNTRKTWCLVPLNVYSHD
jgi:hypothetical protein